jgi:hypothetical protein
MVYCHKLPVVPCSALLDSGSETVKSVMPLNIKMAYVKQEQ